MAIEGENIGGNVIIDWNNTYEFLAQHAAENALNKEDYLSKVLEPIDRVKKNIDIITAKLNELDGDILTEEEFLKNTEPIRKQTEALCAELLEVSLAPFECADFDHKCECFVMSVDNALLPYSDRGKGTWDSASGLRNALDQCSYAQEHFTEMQYELKKIR